MAAPPVVDRYMYTKVCKAAGAHSGIGANSKLL